MANLRRGAVPQVTGLRRFSVSAATHKLPKHYEPTKMRVAFCFLVVNEPHHSELWGRFFAEAERQGLPFEIVVHSKNGCQDPLWAEQALPDPAPTTWEQTAAAHRRIWAHCETLGVDKAILLSESCIPLQTPNYIWNLLAISDKSHIAWHRNSISSEHQNAWRNLKHIKHSIAHCEQWYILDKKHLALFQDTELAELFKHSNGDNESWPITVLFFFGQLHEIHSWQWPKGPTYCNWARAVTEPNGKMHPHTYLAVHIAEWSGIKASGSLFLRKVAAGTDLTAWADFLKLPPA